MNNRAEQQLQEALRALGAETRDAAASYRVRENLVAELRRQHRPRRWLHYAWPVAAAACLAAGFWFGADRSEKTETAMGEPPRLVEPVQEAAARVPEEAATPAPVVEPRGGQPVLRAMTPRQQLAFEAITPWYYHAGLPAPRGGRVLRTKIASATAAQFGVITAADSADAEILIGDDGMARAVRFIRRIPTQQQ
jgi:hypothetical protein